MADFVGFPTSRLNGLLVRTVRTRVPTYELKKSA